MMCKNSQNNSCICWCAPVDTSPKTLEPNIPVNTGALSAGTANTGLVPAGEYIDLETLFYTLGNNIFFVPGPVPITLNAGTYLINFGASVTPDADGIVGLAIAVDEFVNTSSAAFATGIADVTTRLDSSSIISVSEGTSLALVNVGNVNTKYENLIININKIF